LVAGGNCGRGRLDQAAQVGVVVVEELVDLIVGAAGCLGDLPRLPALGVELGDVGGQRHAASHQGRV